ncbi:MAG: ankyrin repeat domain-containing protein, partial [Bacteroidota bacterium]
MLRNLLQPLAHQPESNTLYASAFRRFLGKQINPDVRACRGYVVSEGFCSEIQDLILFDRNQSTVYEESCWKMVPAKSVRAVVRVIGGNLAEPDLVQALREFAYLGQSIRSRSQQAVALGIWAPEAEAWSAEELHHLIKLIGESNPIAYTTHIAIGSSAYFQLQGLEKAEAEYEYVDFEALGIGEAGFVNAALLGKAMLKHLEVAYGFPIQLPESSEGNAKLNLPPNMIIPTKSVALKQGEKNDNMPVKKSDVHTIPQPKRSNSILPNLMRRKKAVEKESAVEVKQLQQDANGNTLLHQAILDKKKDHLLQLLAKSNAALAIKNKEGDTPLHLACALGYREMVQAILQAGPDVNARNYTYATPLHQAIEAGHKGLIELLVAQGAEIEARNNLSQTPLHVAAIKGRIACSQMLIHQGAEIDSRMEKGIQSIHLAAWYGEG